jgi:hypothetical protein
MRIDEADGVCRECGGPLEVIDADDATMTVQCLSSACGDSYIVETDAFNDGGIEYYPRFMSHKLAATVFHEET